ncbi:MAG: zinc ribbon domain-containing protein [Promethearchaeota archaeon]
MKYEKNQYSEGFSYCSMIIGGAFLYWGISSLIGNSWIGLLWIGIALSIFSSQYYALTNRSKLRRIVLNEFISKPNVSLEEIQKKTGISKKDIKAIVLDLRGSGQLRGTFSETTGQMELAPELLTNLNQSQQNSLEQPIITESETNIPKALFCKECGTKITENVDAKYCPYCGSSL